MSKTTSTVKNSFAVAVGTTAGIVVGLAVVNYAFRLPKELRKFIPEDKK